MARLTNLEKRRLQQIFEEIKKEKESMRQQTISNNGKKSQTVRSEVVQANVVNAPSIKKSSTISKDVMTQEKSLKDYYYNKYGKPKDDSEAIDMLIDIFKELINPPFVTLELKEGMGEYYRALMARNLPAFEWLLEAIHVVSKKTSDKRNFPYIVGMIRSWMKYGFGHIPSKEEDDIIDYFEEVISEKASEEARVVLYSLMGSYGVVKMARMMGVLDKKKDVGYLMAIMLKDMMEKKFTQTLNQQSSLAQ